ncbi:MAG TPA: PsbP-related protein [Clostridia bacterium]|nr:PsbP-related protein [Clostridia bacterium]
MLYMMHVIVVGSFRKKLKNLTLIVAVWALLFMLGSYFIDNMLLFSIRVDSLAEFSYPYEIKVDDIWISDAYADKTQLSVFCPSEPKTREFTDFESVEGSFGFKYPSAFVIRPQSFTGGDVLYHIDFHDSEGKAHGFVQVWNLPGSLGDFLKKSIESSSNTYKFFNSNKVEINGVKGYRWDYSVLTGSGYYRGAEVFLQRDGRMYRLSYFVPEKDWDRKQADLFEKMVQSFKIK